MPNPISGLTPPVRLPFASTFAVLPGEFYIQDYGGYLLTANGGGGQTVDAIGTDVPVGTPLDATSKFRLWHDTGTLLPSPISRFAIQTSSGNYITAVDGGGRVTDVLHTDATEIRAWEEFGLEAVDMWEIDGISIKTVYGNYITAVKMVGETTEALHTDALVVAQWETFFFRKSGDLGSGYRYYITPEVGAIPIFATGGGGQVQNAITEGAIGLQPLSWAFFTLLQQQDGTYAIRTVDGHYVTAVGGGGLAYGTVASDNLQTDRTAVGAWEKFTFVDRGDGDYCIQTVSGYYLGPRGGLDPQAQGAFSTDISDINVASRFTLTMVGL